MGDSDFTRKLARFCAGFTLDQAPPEVVAKARLCVLDFFANVYGSLQLEAVRKVAAWVRSLGEGGVATAIGCGFRTGEHHAAFVNGTAAEAIEAQDGLRFGGNHPVSAVIPAALAVAEARGAGGQALLEAIVVGYEVSGRCAAAVHPSHTLSGFLPTGTCGTFGAAAAVAKILGLDEPRTLDALGNAGFLLPLSMGEHLMAGCLVKIVQGGQAASAGITAAGLAGAGIDGHPQVLEGSCLGGGFTRITVRAEPHLERLTDGLGERWVLSDVYFKPYTACRHTHGAAQATLELAGGAAFAADDVVGVTVDTYSVAAIAVGKGLPESPTFVSAQFSIPYVVAACVTDRAMGPAQLDDSRLHDPALRRLAERVVVNVDGDFSAAYPGRTPSRVTIELRDGRRLSATVDIPKGDPRTAMDMGEIFAKLRCFASTVEPARLDALAGAVANLDRLDDVRGLVGTV